MASQQSEVSLGKQLFSMTWPMLFGVLSIMSFQLVDSAFIGQLGVLPLAAQGFTMPIQLVLIGVQVGLGIAMTSMISKALGAKKQDYARQLAGLVLLLGTASVALCCVLIWLLTAPILGLLSAPDNVYAVVNSYWPWWLLSALFGAFIYFYYSICRANGNTMLPGALMVVTSLLNIVLDPIFIFTFGFGLEGAAMATIVSFAIGIVVIVPKVVANHWLAFNFRDLNIIKTLAEVGHIMGPAMVSQLLPSVSSMAATKLVAGFGATAVAAWALASRFEFFVIVTALALTMSMPPMVGRMLGAKAFDDIEHVIKIAIRFLLVFQSAVALLTFAMSGLLSSAMTSDTAVGDVLHWHLLIVPISLGPLGVCMIMVSICNALGKPYRALIISALRLFVFFLPCLWIGSQIAELKGMFVGVLVGNILAGICAHRIYKTSIKQLRMP
ncbi:MATE family efflux transporter [Marinomonas mediterranea]|jgi:putative efflux protein, MATE family|uniref:MATE efflux family protein n=1 Tax=Marinomonas mediterranea (strain ATCC 700492 / JCM 21426 / NBRC 103028 / MMB-1) TaxID=717774 RepID=F2JZG1_MARM1|nr:MATE family efflux transporter [Marinomonas mediterranea]ADZ89744.1 MATE efflux family protein [Marinomonas mediterranea MMB-1]WCN15969.1 MATE family efflux transporter [Marinomonas mediterranea MMB-1]